MPADDIRAIATQLQEIRETILITLGDQSRAGVLMERIDLLVNKVDDLHVLIHGEPKQPERGLLFRLDRIEQKHQTWSKVLWTSVVTIVGCVAKAIWDLVSKI